MSKRGRRSTVSPANKRRAEPTPRRSRWLALAAIAVALVAAAALWLRRPSGAGPIILISIDTLRADHLPVYGYRKVQTPNIDALARDSVVFEHAYAHAPQTLPSHTTILSGALPFEHGVRDNLGFTVKPGQWFIQRALQGRGWPTGGFVSAYVIRAETGLNQGFDTYDSEMPPASAEQSVADLQRDGAATLDVADRWLDARAPAKPFFLFLHLYEPHTPYTPPARFAAYAPYDGEIAYADELVGRFLDHLRGKGLYDASTIVLLSDHGEGLGEHGEQEHGLFLYSATMRVPLLIKAAGHHRSRRFAAPVQHIDLVPTLLDMAGIAKPAALRGRSLLAVLNGASAIPETGIYAEAMYARYHFGWSELYSLTDARYRMIRAPHDELYDLQQDAAEQTSIASERPQVVQAMRGAIQQLVAGVPLAGPAAVSADERARLAALGYVGSAKSPALSLPGDQLPDPKDKVALLEKYRRAAELAGTGRFPEAIALYREVVAEDPGMTDVWLQLAQAEERGGDVPSAFAAYKQVVARDPSNAAGLIGAGNALLRMGKVDEARQYGDLATAVVPAAAHELLTKIALARRDAATAAREADLTNRADPSVPMPLYVRGLLLHDQGRFADALEPLMQAHAALAGRTLQMNDLAYYIADSLANLGRYPEAERYFDEELRVFPRNSRARAGLAMLERSQGRNAEAEREVEEILRLSPNDEGRFIASQLFTMFGEPDKARQVRIR